MSSDLQSQIVAASVESGKAMGSSLKGEGKEEGLAELFKLNQVWYRMPPTLSLVSKRCVTRCNFQQLTYEAPLSQQIASVIFNTGEFQVNGRTSFLVIQAGIDKSQTQLAGIFQAIAGASAPTQAESRSVAHAYLGNAGIMSIFDEITYLSASGTEVDRQQNKGLQQAHVTRNRQSLDWYNTQGELQGYYGGAMQDNYDGKGWVGQVQVNVAGAVISPYLIPERGVARPDYTSDWIAKVQSGTVNTNAVPSTTFDSTKFSGPISTGSVDVSFDSTYNATYNPNPGLPLEFHVPLCDVLGMFSPYMNALIPSQLLAGGRLELRFKDMSEALIATGPSFASPNQTGSIAAQSTTATSNASTFLNRLRIYNIYLLLDSFQLNEGTLARLNETAAGTEGLSMMFDTWDWTQTPFTSNSGEAQVSQARSRILRSFCVIRDQGNRTNPWANSLASEAAIDRAWGNAKNYNLTTVANGYQLLVNSYQAQLGSLYFPQQPLTTLEEYVMNSYYVWSRDYVDPNETNAVSLSDFIGANGNAMWSAANPPAIQAPILLSNYTAGPNTPTNAERSASAVIPQWAMNWGSSTYGFLAERSQLLQLSGLPISNARLLRHRFTLNYSAESGQGRFVDCFTEYTRVSKIFLGGRVVMRE